MYPYIIATTRGGRREVRFPLQAYTDVFGFEGDWKRRIKHYQ
jgi:hypothetical protein